MTRFDEDSDSNVRPSGVSPRMMRQNPNPTEFQLSGGITGVMIVGVVILTVLYAVLKMLGWL
jgi:hypothetical protein